MAPGFFDMFEMEKITTTECQPTEFFPDIRSLVSGHLQSGESILFSCQTAHKSPFYKANAYGQIITERRVIQAIRNQFLKIELAPRRFDPTWSLGVTSGIQSMVKNYGGGNWAGSILLTDIVGFQSINYRLGCCSLKISGVGATELNLVFSSNEVLQKFFMVLRKAKEETKVNSSLESANIRKRLEDLTQLYKDGLITEVEYQNKRKEILNQL